MFPPNVGIFASSGCHVCQSPCVSSTADPLSFFPRSHPNSGGLIFSLSLLHCSPLPFSLPFLPCCPWSRPRARQGLIAQRHHWSMRVSAYRALRPAGFHPEMQSYLHTSCKNLAMGKFRGAESILRRIHNNSYKHRVDTIACAMGPFWRQHGCCFRFRSRGDDKRCLATHSVTSPSGPTCCYLS